MISEISFSTQHSSLWHILAPNSERFIRHINLNVERYGLESPLGDTPERRGYLNEVAFQLVRLSASNSAATIADAAEVARENLLRLDRPKSSDLSDPRPDEVDGISKIKQSLLDFISCQSGSQADVAFAPEFPGCGFLSASTGDLLIKKTLFEVKAGDRLFRSTDLRQLLTYCAMDFASNKYQLEKAGCINPRRGVFFALSLDTIAYEVSGKAAAELFSDMIYFLSSSGISR